VEHHLVDVTRQCQLVVAVAWERLQEVVHKRVRLAEEFDASPVNLLEELRNFNACFTAVEVMKVASVA